MSHFNFTDLIILDLANNHQGDVSHGQRIISELGVVTREMNVRAAIKFQFRHLDTFIHPDHHTNSTAPHVSRFLETALSPAEFGLLLKEVREQGLLASCTPFDEVSVQRVIEMDFDFIKVASCSIVDMPLLTEIARNRKPVVISTAGVPIDQVDKVVNLMTRQSIDFALEHCVSIYPTPSSHCSLNQIGNLKQRYPEVPIGWSTHEHPDDTTTVGLAYSKGATIFERHVGVETKNYKLNKYSSTPKQITSWLIGLENAKARCGPIHRSPPTPKESESLRTLTRGVFAARDIKEDEMIGQEDIFFSIPAPEDGLLVSQWREGLTAPSVIKRNEAIPSKLGQHVQTTSELVDQIVPQIRGMLHMARIKLSRTSTIELSHHYGLKRFREFGAVIINVINREYCKKLIVQLPRQKHPYHYHKQKEETFQVLSGSLDVEKNGSPTSLHEGDIYLVEPQAWHKFSTMNGAIFEEISTTHYINDSFYEDPAIESLTREDRKTVIKNWQY